jgi:PAS domain S-box-containing protein
MPGGASFGFKGFALLLNEITTAELRSIMQEQTALYNSRIVKTYVAYVTRYYPHLNIESLLASAGIHLWEVDDTAHWFSQAQTDALNRALIQATDDPNIAQEAGRFITATDGLGPIRQYTLGLIGLESIFLWMEKLYPLITRGASVKTRKLGPRKVEIISTPKPGVVEKQYQCDNRLGTFESLARLFSDQYAKIEHTHCYHKGHRYCRYLVIWRSSPSLIWRRSFQFALIVGGPLVLVPIFWLPLWIWFYLALAWALGVSLTGVFGLMTARAALTKTLRQQGRFAEKQLDESRLRYNNALLVQEIGKAAASLQSVDELMRRTAAIMHRHLRFDRGLIMLVNPQGDRLEFAAGFGYSAEQARVLRDTRFRLDAPDSQGFFVLAFREQRPFLSNDLEAVKDQFSQRSQGLLKQMDVKAMICVPIVYEKRSLGILAFDNYKSKQAFNQSSLSLLNGIASQVATSITNAKAFQKLSESELKYRHTLESIEEGYIELDLRGNFIFINEAVSHITGYSQEELLALNYRHYTRPAMARKIFKTFNTVFKTGHPARFVEVEVIGKQKMPITFELSVSALKNEDLAVIGFRAVLRDVTDRLKAEQERQQLEAQLLQAQKMESVGNLAGGIAHNFNNMLMGISGNIALMQYDLAPGHPNHKRILSIEKIVQSASQMTRQLLGYARGGKYEVKVFNLNDVLVDTAMTFAMTRREISLKRNLSPDLKLVEADRNQIEQVLWNLFVNAADAMPDGGTLTLETRNIMATDTITWQDPVRPGDYVYLGVADTGIGIEKGLQEHLFEPFFTTKEAGKGTGLGLASVYGIVKSHNGFVLVDSAPGEGATFMIYLPISTKRKVNEKPFEARLVPGSETILLIDDEEMVVDVCEQLLRELGYRVLVARSGEEGITQFTAHQEEIDLVIIDMIMPGMNGGETFDHLRELVPELKVLLSSGYSLDKQAEKIMGRGCNGFIQKPFSLRELSSKIRATLDSRQTCAAGEPL